MLRPHGLTRQEILTAIKLSGSLSTEALAEQFGLSCVAVRQHLATLQAEGSVTVEVQRRSRGHPIYLYRVTDSGDEQFPRRYAETAADLIEELSAWQGEEAVQALFARKRERETPLLRERLRNKDSAACVEEVARIQSENGHMAHIEPGNAPGEYLLVQHNCALCSLARRFPYLCCHNEQQQLQDLLPTMTVTREAHLLAGDHVCTYRLRTTVIPAVTSQ